MIVKFSSNNLAWKFIKHVAANRVTIMASKPLSESSETFPQRPWAQLEQPPEEAAHSALVGKTVRGLHLLREAQKLNGVQFDPHYGNAENGGYIVFTKDNYEGKAASIKHGEITWDESVLTRVGLSREIIDGQMGAM